ncbi:TrmH family RNA methyltransferase [Clostridium aminobutyricum]|uniref:RNA methyltransferase n=1 Tax=Clostridium aminobutyricum TaxID=33953 RepID=A0A939IK39_CLOAM|nr:RNA methyltransferase [Clostridium aminobutyricum]MBN7774238.1 RNA methyltransferase [Clostridium aminobutyricum]
MKKITSQDNKIMKLYQQLENKKYRDKYGKYLIEGPNVIEEALQNRVLPESLIVSESYWERSELKQLCNQYGKLKNSNPEESLFLVEDKLFLKLMQTEHSQGIIGIVQKREYGEEEFFHLRKEGSGNFLILDRLQDPGNVGTIIRTADAAGYEGILVLKGTVDLFSPKVVRACTGSLFRMPLFFVDTPIEAVELLAKYGKKVVSTGFETDTYYYDIDLTSNIGLVIGNEGNGICQSLLEQSNEVVKIPMSGSVESLNAAVAAAILMYESVRTGK